MEPSIAKKKKLLQFDFCCVISINRGKVGHPAFVLEAFTVSKKANGIREECGPASVFVIQLHKPDSTDLRPLPHMQAEVTSPC